MIIPNSEHTIKLKFINECAQYCPVLYAINSGTLLLQPYLSLKVENGFDIDMSMSNDRHKNQASEAISKNSNNPALKPHLDWFSVSVVQIIIIIKIYIRYHKNIFRNLLTTYIKSNSPSR